MTDKHLRRLFREHARLLEAQVGRGLRTRRLNQLDDAHRRRVIEASDRCASVRLRIARALWDRGGRFWIGRDVYRLDEDGKGFVLFRAGCFDDRTYGRDLANRYRRLDGVDALRFSPGTAASARARAMGLYSPAP